MSSRPIDQQFFDNPGTLKGQRYVSVKQLAAHLNVAPKTIYSWVYKSWIIPERVGPRLIRFDMAKVERWLQQQQEEPRNNGYN